MRSWPVLLALALMGAPMAASGCGTDGHDVDACKQIEEARCRVAPNCPEIQLTPPQYTNGSAVDACIRYYDVACLHGLNADHQSGTTVDKCVQAISNACGDGGACKGDNAPGCAIIEDPSRASACAWLGSPNPPPPDASDVDAPDSDAADSGNDTGDAVVMFPDGF
jgi:hypothetical protein